MGIRLAVVGCGRFDPEFIRLFRDHPLVESVALCDAVAERVKENLSRFGLRESYDNLDPVTYSNM